jgi:hypothetical protein
MLASMNLLKSLSAKREKSEMRLVEYATNPVSMGQRMSQLRSAWNTMPWMIGVFIFYIISTLYNDWDFNTAAMCMFAVYGLSIITIEHELQLLRLIKHYREED